MWRCGWLGRNKILITRAVRHFAITTFISGRWDRLPSCLIAKVRYLDIHLFYVCAVLVKPHQSAVWHLCSEPDVSKPEPGVRPSVSVSEESGGDQPSTLGAVFDGWRPEPRLIDPFRRPSTATYCQPDSRELPPVPYDGDVLDAITDTMSEGWSFARRLYSPSVASLCSGNGQGVELAIRKLAGWSPGARFTKYLTIYYKIILAYRKIDLRQWLKMC